VVETGYETLTPGERVKGFGQRIEVEEGELTANGIQGSTYLLSLFSFGVTGVKTSMAHQLHAFGWDMFDDKGDGVFVPYVQRFRVWLT
jgi:hypothetical protein